ncbi:hypothetical protein [Salinilacihabitans rarus]|uniref:hypothetical protein n=1 Tax=Salinilacihabitans rarus TaxID=2961596 RepID=UPI0020C85032|nr:hypothetical protein [Salinilacihabitans rarus]
MSQPQDPRERIHASDDPLVEPFGHPVTINELHALVLGVSGLVVGYALPLLGPLLPLYAIFGRPPLRSLPHDKQTTIGRKTIKHEPWYFTVSYTGAFLLGTVI